MRRELEELSVVRGRVFDLGKKVKESSCVGGVWALLSFFSGGGGGVRI